MRLSSRSYQSEAEIVLYTTNMMLLCHAEIHIEALTLNVTV